MTTAGEHYRKVWMKTQLDRLDRDEARETSAPAGTLARCKARLAAADGVAPTVTRAEAKRRLAALDGRAASPGSRPVGRTSSTPTGAEYRRVVKCVIGNDNCESEFIGRPDQRAIVDAHADAQLQRWATSGRRIERGNGGTVLLRGGKR
jgi:hypothetical protein